MSTNGSNAFTIYGMDCSCLGNILCQPCLVKSRSTSNNNNNDESNSIARVSMDSTAAVDVNESLDTPMEDTLATASTSSSSTTRKRIDHPFKGVSWVDKNGCYTIGSGSSAQHLSSQDFHDKVKGWLQTLSEADCCISTRGRAPTENINNPVYCKINT